MVTSPGLARQVQVGLAPPVPSAYPYLDVYAEPRPASAVGSDFFDFSLLDDMGLLGTIGDVAGKGIPAALLVAMTRTPAPDYRRPRWPDPDHPAQVHLDIAVPDAAADDEAVLSLGATRLPEWGDYRSYEDPTGHPFCLFTDTGAKGGALPGRIGRIVFDCLSPRVLATFYEGLLGMRRFADKPRRVTIAGEEGAPMLAFQATQHVPPRWPDPAHPQHLHLDIGVDSSYAAGERAIRLGAMPLAPQGGSCPVFADPSGHPFCLCGPGE